MSYKVNTIAPFRKEAKKLIKKYPSLKHELAQLGSQLSIDPTIGSALGNNCNKIRLAIASKGVGKTGGARVITHFYVAEDTVFLLSIYDKRVEGLDVLSQRDTYDLGKRDVLIVGLAK